MGHSFLLQGQEFLSRPIIQFKKIDVFPALNIRRDQQSVMLTRHANKGEIKKA
jgi:hypothetical protein